MTQLDVTAIIAKRAFTVILPNPSLTKRHANVSIATTEN
jgi:hypothetical protein